MCIYIYIYIYNHLNNLTWEIKFRKCRWTRFSHDFTWSLKFLNLITQFVNWALKILKKAMDCGIVVIYQVRWVIETGGKRESRNSVLSTWVDNTYLYIYIYIYMCVCVCVYVCVCGINERIISTGWIVLSWKIKVAQYKNRKCEKSFFYYHTKKIMLFAINDPFSYIILYISFYYKSFYSIYYTPWWKCKNWNIERWQIYLCILFSSIDTFH